VDLQTRDPQRPHTDTERSGAEHTDAMPNTVTDTPTMTDNHNYNTPSEGTLNWDVPLNENFEQIDTDIEIRDTDASRSDYSPKEGAKFLATDTGAVYVGDGSDWQQLGSLTSVTVGSNEPSSPTEGDVWIDTS